MRTSNSQYEHNPMIYFHSQNFSFTIKCRNHFVIVFENKRVCYNRTQVLKITSLSMHSNINIVDISMLKIFYIWHTVFCKTIFSCQKNLQKRKAHTHKDRFYLHSLVFPFTSSFIGFISLLDGLNSNFRF